MIISRELIHENTILEFEGRDYTKSSLCRIIDAFKTYFSKIGLRKSDAVLTKPTSSVLNTCFILACAELGLQIIPLDVLDRLDERRKEYFLREVNIKCFFTEHEYVDLGIHGLENIYCMSLRKLMGFMGSRLDTSMEVSPEDILLTSLSSGTEGDPKLRTINHRVLIENSLFVKDTVLSEVESIATYINPCHLAVVSIDVLPNLMNGKRNKILKDISSNPVKVLGALTGVKAVNIFSDLLRRDLWDVGFSKNLRNIKLLSYGGGGLRKSEVSNIFEKFPNIETMVSIYGALEYGGSIAISILTRENIDISFKEEDLLLLHKINKRVGYRDNELYDLETQYSPGDRIEKIDGRYYLRFRDVNKFFKINDLSIERVHIINLIERYFSLSEYKNYQIFDYNGSYFICFKSKERIVDIKRINDAIHKELNVDNFFSGYSVSDGRPSDNFKVPWNIERENIVYEKTPDRPV